MLCCHKKIDGLFSKIHDETITRIARTIFRFVVNILIFTQCDGLEPQLQFSSHIGSELLNFIENVEKVEVFLVENFVETPLLKDLHNGLLLWKKITPFLVMTTIENGPECEVKMNEFVENIKLFHEVGKRTFLTKSSADVGGDETFHLHCLRFYMPRIAKETHEKHNLGLGIFTMQGFERRNKESKHTLKRFCNGKGDILQPNMKRLFDVFIMNMMQLENKNKTQLRLHD